MKLIAFSIFVSSLAACVGSIGDQSSGSGDGTGSGSSPICTDGKVRPGRSPIRRMTRIEFDNTVHDLLGDTRKLGSAFVPEEEMLGFDNNADALTMSNLLAEQVMDAAEALSTDALTRLDTIAPKCDTTAEGDDACAKKFIASFGKRAWRRPLEADESAELFDLYTKGKGPTGTYGDGISLVIQRLIQSPFFLYRVEKGVPGTEQDGAIRLTGHETATRLSYFLWSTMPDDALLADADAGKLDTKEGLAEAARRLLKDPRAKAAVANFHAQWLELPKLASIAKDPAMFPDFDASIRDALRKETETFVDAKVAGFYGMDAPTTSGFVKVPLDPSKRAGILTQGSILAIKAKSNQSSPIHRGKFVREKLLCQMLPPPPADLVIVPPDLDPKLSTRDRFAAHDKNPACSGCHHLMDPIGLGFEHFDAIGKWRDTEGPIPIDATGQILDSQDVDGKFDGARELSQKLATSQQVQSCVVTQWFRFAYGRGEQEDDACSLQTVNQLFQASGGDMRELLVALTQTDAFRYRTIVGGP
ncbi:MAG: DUF1592 domain-containing protein [Polyangiales bacterium]